MNAKLSKHPKLGRILTNIVSLLAILAIALPVTQVAYAASASPFVGQWQATDTDGSDIHLSIGGPPSGPFQITWTESYMSFCDGKAGIVRGTAQLNESDPNLLEAELHVECFTTGASVDFPFAWRYHPLTDKLSSRYENGAVIIWHRPGRPQPTQEALGLRVNYGHDWVESFYETGHMAWITVTESDGVTAKATAELVTEPKDFWDGETGFQTRPEDWIPGPPDIQPNDWVFGWVDNGASGQVQIGEINGVIDLDSDSIRGTVLTDWFAEELYIVCDPWGLSDLSQYRESSVYPDGVDEFECSWSGVLDILPGQELGVWYYGPDGHAVVNAFSTSEARIHASVTGDFFFATDFNPGTLSISIYESAQEDAALLWSDEVDTDESGFVHIDPDVHGLDLMPGNYLVISDGGILKGLVLDLISLDVFDTENDIMAGTAPAGREVMIVAAPGPEWEVQTFLNVLADPETGAWLADFSSSGFDITEEMRGWSFASISDEDGDTNETSSLPPPPNSRLIAFPAVDEIFGYNWPEGSEVHLTINDTDFSQTVTVKPSSWDPNDILAYFSFNGQYDLKPGDVVTLSGSEMERIYTVRNLSVTSVDYLADTVTGTADPGTEVMAYPFEFGDQPLRVTADEDGNWLANFKDAGIDLMEGMCGRSDIFDEFTNSTTVDWCISPPPTPVILAWLEWDTVDTDGWRLGEPVTLTIGDLVLTQNAEVNPGDPNRTWVHFDVGAVGHDLVIGDLVQVSNGLIRKELLIPEVKITDYDLGANTVSGLYDPTLGFRTHVYDQELIDVTFDGNKWIAYFDDLGPLMWGDAVQTDADGDEVSATIRTPNPVFYVVPDEERIFASEWSPGQNLIVSVNGEEVAFQMVPNVGSPYGPEVMFNLNGVFDLQAGQTVTLTDGRSTKDLVVPLLQVTGFDLAGPITISGIADPGSYSIEINSEHIMDITVGEDNTWSASSPEFDSSEWGSVIQTDDDGDQTRDIFMIPWP